MLNARLQNCLETAVSIQVRSLASRDFMVLLIQLYAVDVVSIQVRSLASRDLAVRQPVGYRSVLSFHSGEIPSE